jgi:hypothetical protein
MRVCKQKKSPTPPATLWKFKLAFIISAACLTGCSLFGPTSSDYADEELYSPREQVFFDTFDSVWRATQIALQNYHIRVNNMDKGVIETDLVKGYKGWYPPHVKRRRGGGRRYSLSLRIIKGKINGKPAVKVTILKEIRFQKDFFAEEKNVVSDGLEEKSILYRVERELIIDEALRKAAKEELP